MELWKDMLWMFLGHVGKICAAALGGVHIRVVIVGRWLDKQALA